MRRRADWQGLLSDWLVGGEAVLALPAPVAAHSVVQRVDAAGFQAVPIDFAPITDKPALMRAMQDALALDDWFGANWDALGDALFGPETPVERATVLVLCLPPAGLTLNEADFATLLQIIRDVAGSGRSTLKGAIVLGGKQLAGVDFGDQ